MERATQRVLHSSPAPTKFRHELLRLCTLKCLNLHDTGSGTVVAAYIHKMTLS
jgi:hypothetical protein